MPKKMLRSKTEDLGEALRSAITVLETSRGLVLRLVEANPELLPVIVADLQTIESAANTLADALAGAARPRRRRLRGGCAPAPVN